MTIDILMRVQKDGNNLWTAGESTAKVDNSSGSLTEDFRPGNYIEIDDLDFGISLVDKDTSSDSNSSRPVPHGSGPAPKERERGEGKFAKFIQGITIRPADGQSQIYPVTFDEVSITRQIDRATPALLQTCFNTKALKKITVVKRKVAGTGTTTGHYPYFRVDFEDVLITDLSWSITESLIQEKTKFVYRTITMKYRPQNNDGSPGVVVNVGPLSLVKTTGS